MQSIAIMSMNVSGAGPMYIGAGMKSLPCSCTYVFMSKYGPGPGRYRLPLGVVYFAIPHTSALMALNSPVPEQTCCSSCTPRDDHRLARSHAVQKIFLQQPLVLFPAYS